MQLYKKGKVKEVYEVCASEFEFLFTDQISVFDRVIPTNVPHKGETLCRTSAYWFKEAERQGFKTHFLKLSAPNRMRVRRVRIPSIDEKLDFKSKGHLIPLEVIARYYLAGSMHDRVKRGEVSPKSLGFKSDKVPEYGTELPEPFVEMTTKLEKVDRNLTPEEAMKIAALTKGELAQLRETVLKVDELMNKRVRSRGLIHVDGKKEFAFDGERAIMLVDTFGTADEDRFWELDKYEQGEFVELSKEFVRGHYRKTGYHDELQAARKASRPEPPIPALPPHVVGEVSRLYISLFERLTGEPFR
ncbi:MAG: phosphoribosylaminoimidazolesuccinocarboxamide synthase [Euryarchaeota archaeon]|nr:phosphoribosylaminoimidazolesuccinocarboxamide synthase [Euryarchaeota archaeon]